MNRSNHRPVVEYFFSFRSPYSYLSGPRAFELPLHYPIRLVYRGIRPMAMRGQLTPVAKQMHFLRDAKREANRLRMPFGKMHDPLGSGVWRCLTIAEYAVERNRLPEFVLTASRAIWAEAGDVMRDEVLRDICERAGLDWEGCLRATANPAFREQVEQNTARLASLGQWGVPVFVFNGEAFWGQDRIVDLERALCDAGIAGDGDTELARAVG